jgi:hypothetical protein
MAGGEILPGAGGSQNSSLYRPEIGKLISQSCIIVHGVMEAEFGRHPPIPQPVLMNDAAP